MENEHSPTLPLLHLRHSSFSNPSFASPTSQALHLRHLANRLCISTFVTKFSQNIVADNDKNKALIDCHKCSSSFLSIVKSHPLKIPASVLEKVRSGSCLQLFLIDCRQQCCSTTQTQMFHLKLRNQGCSFTSDEWVQKLPVALRTPLSLQHLNRP